MDRLEAMGVFVAVAEERGFAAAARRLRLSPPSVTRAIAALEARLKVRLLHRTTREVSLTDAGTRLLPSARRLLVEVEEAELGALGADAEPRGPLVITAPVMFGRMFVAPVVLELMGRHAGLQARLLFTDQVVSLADDGVDVAVRIARLGSPADVAVRVGSIRRVVCGAPSYLAKHRAPRRPRELMGHELIGFSTIAQPGPWPFRVNGRTQMVELRPRLVVSSTEVGVAAAVAGHGLTMTLSYQVAEHVRVGALRVVLAEFELPPVPLHVVHRQGRAPSARVRAFVDLAVERLRAHPALASPLRRGRSPGELRGR